MTRINWPKRARYIMVGGFLGAGKSTAVLRLAQHISASGRRVGLITNDQSLGLVDTTFMRSRGFDVQEIAGGCFCCRFNSLVEAARRLTTQSRPHVIIAEPVGSCTDLVATVSYPLRRIYGNDYTIAPLSVLVDPIRALRIFGAEAGPSFSPKVAYIYRKQLEEADLIVINKVDLIDQARLSRLKDILSGEYPDARLLACSARRGEGMAPWYDLIERETMPQRQVMTLDYTLYGEGEALLGWLNCTVDLTAASPFDGESVMMGTAQRIQQALDGRDRRIAHLKMTLTAEGQSGQVAVLSLMNDQYVPELAQSLPEQMRRGQLIVNLRAEAPPNELEWATRQALGKATAGVCNIDVEHLEALRPAPPKPTHRFSSPRQPVVPIS